MRWFEMAGFRFLPRDVELVRDYLYQKVRGQRLPAEGVIIECDLYGDENPWQIWERYGGNVVKALHDEDLYVFTKLKRKHWQAKHVERKVGLGSWEGETGAKEIKIDGTNQCIGFMKRFRFEKSQTNEDGKWIMHEYSLHPSLFPSHLQLQMRDYVVCRIRKNDRSIKLQNKRKEPHSSTVTQELHNSKSRKLQKDDNAPNKWHHHHNLPHLDEENQQRIQQQHPSDYEEIQTIPAEKKEANVSPNLDDEEYFSVFMRKNDRSIKLQNKGKETDSSKLVTKELVNSGSGKLQKDQLSPNREHHHHHNFSHPGEENQRTIQPENQPRIEQQQHPSDHKENETIQAEKEADGLLNLDDEQFFNMPISNMLDDQPLFFNEEFGSSSDDYIFKDEELWSWTDKFLSGTTSMARL